MRKMLMSASLMIIWFAMTNPIYGENMFRAKIKYWNSEIEGDTTAETKLLTGTKLDLTKDLGLEESTYVPELELKLKLGMNKLIGSYAKTSYEGEETLTRKINFGGVSYNVNQLVKTDLDITLGSLLYEKVFISEFITRAFPSVAETELGLLLGVKYLSTEVTLTSAVTGSKKEDGSVPIPVIGLFFQLSMLDKKLNLETGAVGLKTSVSGIAAEYFDLYLEANLNYFGIPFGLGYKINRLNVEDKSSNAFGVNLNLSGLYVFTSLEF